MVRRVAIFTSRWVAPRVLAAGVVALVLAVPAGAAAGPAMWALPAALPPVLVPDGATPYLRTHAVGTQNWVCLATGSGLAWKFV
jgi:hypothetical protein